MVSWVLIDTVDDSVVHGAGDQGTHGDQMKEAVSSGMPEVILVLLKDNMLLLEAGVQVRTVPGNSGMNHSLGNECRGRGAEGRALRGTLFMCSVMLPGQ